MDRGDYAYDARDEARAAVEADRRRPQPDDDKTTLRDIPTNERRR